MQKNRANIAENFQVNSTDVYRTFKELLTNSRNKHLFTER